MAFYRESERKETTITSLIDVVFLLLIFFLIMNTSFRHFESDKKMDEYVTSRELPESFGNPVSKNEPLKSLLIRVDEDLTSNPERKVIYFIKPVNNQTMYDKAFQEAKKDSNNFVFVYDDTLMMKQEDFEYSYSGRQIREKIYTYREFLREKPKDDRFIEISADKNTPFRLIYYLMDQCSNGDSTTVIKKVNIRTLAKSM